MPTFNEDTRLAFAMIAISGFMAPVGAMLGMLAPKGRLEVIPLALAFSAGVLIWVALVGLHPEALESFVNSAEKKYGTKIDEHEYDLANKYMWRPRMYVLLSIFFGLGIGKCIDIIVHKLGFAHDHGTDEDDHGHNHGKNRKATELQSLPDNSHSDGVDGDHHSNILNPDHETTEVNVSFMGGQEYSGNEDPEITDYREESNLDDMNTSNKDIIPHTNNLTLPMSNKKNRKNKNDDSNGLLTTPLSSQPSIEYGTKSPSPKLKHKKRKNSELDKQDLKLPATLTREESRKLLRVSVVTALAITIHNLPEGIATFASTISSPDLGVLVGIAVAMHNIPLGIAVGMPIFMSIPGREGKIKAVLAASCAGFSSLFGGFIAWLVFSKGLSDDSSGVVFGSVIGIMIWTAFKELLPQARQHDKHDKYTTYLVFFGFLVMDCSLVIFDSRGGDAH